MAYGDVTFLEFCKMTEEDRKNAYHNLSDSDKLRVRLSVDVCSSGDTVPCNVCAHRAKNTPNCKAFPNGIDPKHIKMLQQDILTPCGDGIVFMAEEGV